MLIVFFITNNFSFTGLTDTVVGLEGTMDVCDDTLLGFHKQMCILMENMLEILTTVYQELMKNHILYL